MRPSLDLAAAIPWADLSGVSAEDDRFQLRVVSSAEAMHACLARSSVTTIPVLSLALLQLTSLPPPQHRVKPSTARRNGAVAGTPSASMPRSVATRSANHSEATIARSCSTRMVASRRACVCASAFASLHGEVSTSFVVAWVALAPSI